jgi:hypothetical protein
MLTWDRYHRNNEDEWPIRPDGFIGGAAPEGDFCLLLNIDTDDTKTLILNADPTGDELCLQLNTSTT